MEENKRKPLKIKDVSRKIKKAFVASTLEEVKKKAAEKLGEAELLPAIHLDIDGTEVDDEEYFETLEANTELVAIFPGQRWIDPNNYVCVTRHDSGDTTDYSDVERVQLQHLVGHFKSNLRNVTVISDTDMDSLSDMDPNSLADITGKEIIEQLKESTGRIACEKRTAFDSVELLNILGIKKSFNDAKILFVENNTQSSTSQENI